MDQLPQDIKGIILSSIPQKDTRNSTSGLGITNETIIQEIRKLNPSFSLRSLLLDTLERTRMLNTFIDPVIEKLSKIPPDTRIFIYANIYVPNAVFIRLKVKYADMLKSISGVDMNDLKPSESDLNHCSIRIITGPKYDIKDRALFLEALKSLKEQGDPRMKMIDL